MRSGVQISQPGPYIPLSSNGRTRDFDSRYGSSSLSEGAKSLYHTLRYTIGLSYDCVSGKVRLIAGLAQMVEQ